MGITRQLKLMEGNRITRWEMPRVYHLKIADLLLGFSQGLNLLELHDLQDYRTRDWPWTSKRCPITRNWETPPIYPQSWATVLPSCSTKEGTSIANCLEKLMILQAEIFFPAQPTWNCQICDIVMDKISEESHLRGKSHQAKLNRKSEHPRAAKEPNDSHVYLTKQAKVCKCPPQTLIITTKHFLDVF